ncbi:M15 family metallopeptidase [Clostridium lacusfryxellense]|uniref:M15 family metallopeptidase n=1 Tax=Clostridium lacusfryxellense TaxID=205328 RepID=UPI001C0D5F18|nr:M15 family metallopeptidase [Clostridium lacusfryxellense]MBU3111330.1 M15 family metallopeptidase [Clostridium lacusfryxellense]
MKKLLFSTLLISFIFNTCLTPELTLAEVLPIEQNINRYNVTIKQDILCLMIAYPEHIINIDKKNGFVYLVLKSGKKLLYDDKTHKTPENKLTNPDLQDTLEQTYPLTPIKTLMKDNFDPGRCRSYGLLTEVYGSSKQVIESKLSRVSFGSNNYQFNNSSNASTSLKEVMKQLIPLAQSNANVRKCLFPCSGTFNYRLISGTNRLSPHAYGIAIDLASDKRDYWKWASKSEGEKRLASYSNELVEIFEKYGFVWGGKWSHFDILHFEYRPEIILKSRFFANSIDSKKHWYEGAPTDQNDVKKIIEKVDKILGV